MKVKYIGMGGYIDTPVIEADNMTYTEFLSNIDKYVGI